MRPEPCASSVCCFHVKIKRDWKETGKTAKREETIVSWGVADAGIETIEERLCVREIERYIYESWPVAAGPRWLCRLIEIPPAAVTKNNRTDPQCRWLTQHLLLCRAVSVQFYRERMQPAAKPSERAWWRALWIRAHGRTNRRCVKGCSMV